MMIKAQQTRIQKKRNQVDNKQMWTKVKQSEQPAKVENTVRYRMRKLHVLTHASNVGDCQSVGVASGMPMQNASQML